MYSMEDGVLDHAHSNPGSTGDALRLLGLENKDGNIGAANLYLTALKIIQKLEKKLEKPKRRIEIE